MPYRESGLRVVTPPEWIIFLCIPRTQQKNSLGHQIKRKLVCPIHLVGVLQKVSVQSLIFLSLKSLQLRPIFLVLNIPTFCRDKSSKSLMNFIHPHEKTKYFFSEDIRPHEKTKYFFSEDIHPHEKTFIHMGRQMFHLHLEVEK